ncbi:MAG: tripartite tricarboxylate transporter substrate binding protein [Chloroflexota bacterium]
MPRARFRVSVLMVLALLLALSALPAGCATGGNAFPTKAIELVVAFPAGGATDVLMRSLADAVSKDIGQQVVVVNKGGGSGTIGSGEVARAKADGHTVLVMQVGPGATQPHIDSVPYKIEDFEPIMMAFENPLFLVVGEQTPWKNAKEFVEDAKKRPGKIQFGAAPSGGAPHLVMELFAKVAGFQVNIVPFQGGGPASTSLLGGHIDAVTLNPAEVTPLVQGGKVRLLGVSSAERLKEFPDVPTLKEQGYDAVGAVWGGLVVPKGTPKDVQTKLHDAFKKGMESQQVKDSWSKLLTPIKYRPAAEFLKLWQTDFDRYGEIIRDLKKSGRL